MPTMTLDISTAQGNDTPLTQRVSLTAESAIGPLEVAVGVDATDLLVSPLAIDVSQLVYLHISADKAMTLETNDSSSPDDTITLVADKPVVWFTGCGMDCPLTVDVTELYV